MISLEGLINFEMLEIFEIGNTMIIKNKKVNRQKIQQLNELYLFVTANGKELYSYAIWLCGNQTLAQKAIDHANDQIIERIHSKVAISSINTTFFKIIKAYCKQESSTSVDTTRQKKPDYNQQELSLLTRKVLRKVPERYSEPLILQILGGLSLIELADFFDVNEPEIEMRLSAARKIVSSLISLELSLSQPKQASEVDIAPNKYYLDLLNGENHNQSLNHSTLG